MKNKLDVIGTRITQIKRFYADLFKYSKKICGNLLPPCHPRSHCIEYIIKKRAANFQFSNLNFQLKK